MVNTENIKGIIFDYGGTIDSQGDHWSHIIRRGYDHAGVVIGETDFREAYVFAERALATHPYILPQHNFLDLMSIKIGIEMDFLVEKGLVSKELAERKAPQIARYCYDAARECVEQAKPVIEALSQRYPLVLVSNFYGNIEAVLADFGLDRFFPVIIESAVVGVRKPDPAIFDLGVKALKGLKPEEVLVVGDSLRKDILPARSLGCATAWIKGRGWTPEEDAAQDSAQVTDLKEIADALLA